MYDTMAAMVHFFRISPAEFWDLDRDELSALLRYRERYLKG